MKRSLLLGLLLLVTACGHLQPAAPPAPAAGSAFVLGDGGSHVMRVDLASGTVGRPLKAGVMSPDGRRLYAVVGSQLTILDPETGAMLGGYPLPAALDLPRVQPQVPAGLSHDGSRLVLESTAPTRSRFWVLEVASGRSQTVDLDGNYEFDGIADDGSNLFLLNWLPGQPGRYSVRAYDLRAGRLQPFTLTDKTEGIASMRGERVAGVTNKAGSWQYTLYIGGSTGAFIHALELEGDFPIAWCVDLPATDPVLATGWSIAMAPDGAIYAANPAAGRLVTIHHQGDAKPTIDRVSDISMAASTSWSIGRPAEAKELMGGVAAVDGDRMYAPGPGIAVLDLKTGRRSATWLQGSLVRSVAAGGGRLLALDDGNQLLAIDPQTGGSRPVAGGFGYAIAILAVR